VGEWCPLGKQRPPFAEQLPAGDRRTMRTVVECSLPGDPPALPIENRARPQTTIRRNFSVAAQSAFPTTKANRLTGASVVNPGSEILSVSRRNKNNKTKRINAASSAHPPKSAGFYLKQPSAGLTTGI